MNALLCDIKVDLDSVTHTKKDFLLVLELMLETIM